MNRIAEMNKFLEPKTAEILRQQEDLFCHVFQEQKKRISHFLKDLKTHITDKEHKDSFGRRW